MIWAGSQSSQTVPELQLWQLQTGPTPADEPGMKQEEPHAPGASARLKHYSNWTWNIVCLTSSRLISKNSIKIILLISKIICILIGKTPSDAHLPVKKQAFEGWALWPWKLWAFLYYLSCLELQFTPVASQTKLMPAPAISNTPQTLGDNYTIPGANCSILEGRASQPKLLCYHSPHWTLGDPVMSST